MCMASCPSMARGEAVLEASPEVSIPCSQQLRWQKLIASHPTMCSCPLLPPRLRCGPVGSHSPPLSFGRATPAKPPEEDRGRTVMLPGAWWLCGDHGTQTLVRTLRFLVSPQ